MQRNKRIDKETKKYIRRVKILQTIVVFVVFVLFVLFARIIVYDNSYNLKQVALAKVQESMQETIGNIVIRIDTIRARVENDAMIEVIDLEERIKKSNVKTLEDLLFCMDVCEENQLGQAIEAFYRIDSGNPQHVEAYSRDISLVTNNSEAEAIYSEAPICTCFTLGRQEIILFIRQSETDILAQEEIRNYIHSEEYEGNQYVWVNEIVNMEGGENYAIRRIHPNLVEAEGEYLSTNIQDIKGNYPYLTELEGIRENGQVFHHYYFKNYTDDEICEKYSYAEYYEPFSWVIATGETIEEVYEYSDKLNENSINYTITLMILCGVVFITTTSVMIKILGNQAKNFQKKLMKQTEVYEDMYTTMSVGLFRLRMTAQETEIVTVNPKGLELLGVENEEECRACLVGHEISTMDVEDAKRLTELCKNLEEQWTGESIECRVKWKDGSIHLLQITNTLIDYDGSAKIIQRLCHDITEERKLQELALQNAEEKATLDPMTQLKNKKAIEIIIRNKLDEAAKKNLPIAVGFVDIDNFRDYNTKYGHLQGDEVIKHVAFTLRDYIPGIVGRNGGDEFAFCALDVSQERMEEAMKSIHRILNVGIKVKESGEIIPTPCSIGIVYVQGSEINYDIVMEQSDEAMYEAKARGKNTYVILDKRI